MVLSIKMHHNQGLCAECQLHLSSFYRILLLGEALGLHKIADGQAALCPLIPISPEVTLWRMLQ